MKSILKSIIIIGLFVFQQQIVFAQDADKTVAITVSGSGKTQEEAKQSAFRSAIEQAFGAFISSKTEILNDQVVADQIASVANGNIQSFSILNESQLPDGSWGITLKALVSVSKLTSFVESKGISIEIKGGLFALNIKQQKLNEEGEIKAICEMVGLLHEPMQMAFDYNIKSGEPKSLDPENKNWEIALNVTATTNKNIDFCANYLINTLAALSLSSEEVSSYQSLKKAVFPVVINYNGVDKTIYLRKKSSIKALNTLTNQWEFYTRLFTVESGMDESNGNGEGSFHFFSKKKASNDFTRDDTKKIYFLTAGQQAATFFWQDKRTLSQIEQMTGYKVKPRGIVSQFKHGGFVVYEVPTLYGIGAQMEAAESNMVKLLTPGGIAEKARMKPGDKIISINDIQVVDGNMSQLINKSEKENKLCEFKIERAGKIKKLDIYPSLEPGYGLVAAITDLENLMDWNSAKTACDELILNGYSDWHLPSKEELNLLYFYLHQFGVGDFKNQKYWSSSEYKDNYGNQNAGRQDFSTGKQDDYYKNQNYYVRPVRAF